MACELYCCLLPQCEALRTCRSGYPIATKWCCDQDVKVVPGSALSHKERAIAAVRYKKEDMLLQPLRWCCVKSVIHHERDVREEQHHTYMWREHAIIECSWHGKKALYCCLLPQCEALRTCLCPQVSLSLQSSSAICHINFLIKAALDSAMTSPRKALIDKNAVYDLKCDDSIRNNFLHTC